MGGFTITAVVHLFNLTRFTPIVRPTVLTAFLGYLFVILALLFDLGQPQRIWHALVMWNPRSVMFEVAWCVMLYTTVLALEFSPVVFERLSMERPRRIVRAISIPLVIVGVILSTLHQSSLGSLYLIVPMKLHPLWYSPLLPVFFFVSAIAAGLAMVIVESSLCQRAFDHHLEMGLLEPLGRAMVVVLSVYGILRVRARQPGLVTGAFLAILGFVMHRLNVSVTGMERAAGVAYFPSWMEIALSLALVAAGFAVFGLAVRYLPIFPEAPHRASGVEAPAWLLARPASMIAGGSPEPLSRPSAPAGME